MEPNAPTQEPLRGRVSGLRWEAERCPDARPGDALRPACLGGLVGLGIGLLGRLPAPVRLAAVAAGAAAGALASHYHLNLDWDPDHLRPDPPTPEAPEHDAPGDEPPRPL